MGQWWSDMNGYENFPAMCAAQINSLQNYQLTMQHMFADGIFNIGRIKVWFYVSQSLYKKIPAHEWEQCHELVMEWFSVFETKCPVIHVEHMRNKWDEIGRCWNVLSWNINTCTNLSMISPCRTTERDTVKPIYLCVKCEREFYAKEHLFRHNLVHKVCVLWQNCPKA